MLQKIINILYRYPKARLKTFKRFGGYRNYKKMIRLSRLMESKSAELSPVKSFGDGLPVYFLTGKKYLYQTLFCIQSLNRVTNEQLRFVLVDDGSFDEELLAQIRKQLPDAGIVTRQMIEENLHSVLPEQRYPHLNQKRKVYPHIKKLTDIHTIAPTGWKLVLDSDMLFWSEPTALLNWLQNPVSPVYMLDCQESYGYSRQLMEKLCGNKIPELLNVGVIGINSADINWDKIDHWVGVLEENEGASYYLEQALTAMLLADVKAEILPSATYIVNPDSTMVNSAAGVLHHYVDLSKDDYFTTAWKKLI